MAVGRAPLPSRFRVAFDAWRATDPESNPNAPPARPTCRNTDSPGWSKRRRSMRRPTRPSTRGAEAGETSDKYVRATVYLASVLFLIGISTRFPIRGGRYALVGLGVLMLLISVVQLASAARPADLTSPYQARSIISASSALVGGCGLKPSSGRCSIASRASSSLSWSAPAAPRPGGSPPSWRIRASISAGRGFDRPRQRLDRVRRAGLHEGHRPRQDRGVGLGMGAAADPDQRLADDVVDREQAGVDRVAAEDRPLGEGGAVARLARFVE